MERFLGLTGLGGVLSDMPRQVMAAVNSPVFFVQIGLIAAAGLIAYAILPRVRRLLVAIIHYAVPRSWVTPIAKAVGSVAAPLFWLLVLWISLATARALGLPFEVVNAAVSLLVAWVCIRVLSFAVRSPLLSTTISVIAWSIAALSILNLLGPIMRQLDQTAFTLGSMRVSGLIVVRAILMLAVLLWIATTLVGFLERRINQAQTLTPSLQVLLTQVLRIFVPIAAVVVALAIVGVNLTALTVLSGAVGIGVGLGLQKTVSNFVAGLTLIINKSIKPGDVIAYKETYGWVTAMGARYVQLRTRDGIEYLVPNDFFLENGLENWSHTDRKLRIHVPVGIAYEADPHEAIALCIAAAKSVKRVVERPEPLCLVKGFGDSSVDLEIRAWIEDPINGVANVKSAIMLAVWDRFQEAGIRIPFPQRDIHIIPPKVPPQEDTV